jgi:hypothetical protein
MKAAEEAVNSAESTSTAADEDEDEDDAGLRAGDGFGFMTRVAGLGGCWKKKRRGEN